MVYIFGNKSLEELNEGDIQGLVDRKEEESIILEFKKELTNNSKEIAKDISSMSNSEGGFIIYGINEDENGKASSIGWISSTDNLEERLENIIATTIHPTPPFRIFPISNQEDDTKKICLILIPKSYNLHMVIKDRDNRYYKRVGRTIHKMEDSEIKNRIGLIRESEEDIDTLVNSLNSEFHEKTGTNLNSINRIHYFVIPNELNKKFKTMDELKIRLDEIQNPITEGRNFPAYNGNIANFFFSDERKWIKSTIIHQNGIIEFRRSKDFIEYFASYVEAQKLLSLIDFANQFFSKINYYGGYKICLEIGNLGKYAFNPTFENTQGVYNFSLGEFRTSVEFESILTQQDDKNKLKIFEIMKIVGGTVEVSDEEAYKEVKELLGLITQQ